MDYEECYYDQYQGKDSNLVQRIAILESLLSTRTCRTESGYSDPYLQLRNSYSECSCDSTNPPSVQDCIVPRVFSETYENPVRDVQKSPSRSQSTPPICSFFNKLMDNAKSILSMKRSSSNNETVGDLPPEEIKLDPKCFETARVFKECETIYKSGDPQRQVECRFANLLTPEDSGITESPIVFQSHCSCSICQYTPNDAGDYTQSTCSQNTVQNVPRTFADSSDFPGVESKKTLSETPRSYNISPNVQNIFPLSDEGVNTGKSIQQFVDTSTTCEDYFRMEAGTSPLITMYTEENNLYSASPPSSLRGGGCRAMGTSRTSTPESSPCNRCSSKNTTVGTMSSKCASSTASSIRSSTLKKCECQPCIPVFSDHTANKSSTWPSIPPNYPCATTTNYSKTSCSSSSPAFPSTSPKVISLEDSTHPVVDQKTTAISLPPCQECRLLTADAAINSRPETFQQQTMTSLQRNSILVQCSNQEMAKRYMGTNVPSEVVTTPTGTGTSNTEDSSVKFPVSSIGPESCNATKSYVSDPPTMAPQKVFKGDVYSFPGGKRAKFHATGSNAGPPICFCTPQRPTRTPLDGKYSFLRSPGFTPTEQQKKSCDDLQFVTDKQKDIKTQMASIKKRSVTYTGDLNNYEQLLQQGGADFDKISKDLKMENMLLRNELQDLKLELKQCIERVQGPMQHKLLEEQCKCQKLEEQLKQTKQQMENKERNNMEKILDLKKELTCTCNNVEQLTGINQNLQQELDSLNALCGKLEDDLIKQKMLEAETITLLSKKIGSQNSKPCNCKSDDFICEENLHVIARKLSETLRQSDPCAECANLPPEIKSAVVKIKELTDLVDRQKGEYGEDVGFDDVPTKCRCARRKKKKEGKHKKKHNSCHCVQEAGIQTGKEDKSKGDVLALKTVEEEAIEEEVLKVDMQGFVEDNGDKPPQEEIKEEVEPTDVKLDIQEMVEEPPEVVKPAQEVTEDVKAPQQDTDEEQLLTAEDESPVIKPEEEIPQKVEEVRPLSKEELPQTVEEVRPLSKEQLPQTVEEVRPLSKEELPQTVDEVRPLSEEQLPQTVEEVRPLSEEQLPQNIEEVRPLSKEQLPQEVEEVLPLAAEQLQQNIEEVFSTPNEELPQKVDEEPSTMEETKEEPEVEEKLSEVEILEKKSDQGDDKEDEEEMPKKESDEIKEQEAPEKKSDEKVVKKRSKELDEDLVCECSVDPKTGKKRPSKKDRQKKKKRDGDDGEDVDEERPRKDKKKRKSKGDDDEDNEGIDEERPRKDKKKRKSKEDDDDEDNEGVDEERPRKDKKKRKSKGDDDEDNEDIDEERPRKDKKKGKSGKSKEDDGDDDDGGSTGKTRDRRSKYDDDNEGIDEERPRKDKKKRKSKRDDDEDDEDIEEERPRKDKKKGKSGKSKEDDDDDDDGSIGKTRDRRSKDDDNEGIDEEEPRKDKKKRKSGKSKEDDEDDISTGKTKSRRSKEDDDVKADKRSKPKGKQEDDDEDEYTFKKSRKPKDQDSGKRESQDDFEGPVKSKKDKKGKQKPRRDDIEPVCSDSCLVYEQENIPHPKPEDVEECDQVCPAKPTSRKKAKKPKPEDLPLGVFPPPRDFPFEVKSKIEPIQRNPPSNLHVTTTVTDSGTLEVVTEGPTGIIETSMVYTSSGNVEVVTEVLERDSRASGSAVEERGDFDPCTCEKPSKGKIGKGGPSQMSEKPSSLGKGEMAVAGPKIKGKDVYSTEGYDEGATESGTPRIDDDDDMYDEKSGKRTGKKRDGVEQIVEDEGTKSGITTDDDGKVDDDGNVGRKPKKGGTEDDVKSGIKAEEYRDDGIKGGIEDDDDVKEGIKAEKYRDDGKKSDIEDDDVKGKDRDETPDVKVDVGRVSTDDEDAVAKKSKVKKQDDETDQKPSEGDVDGVPSGDEDTVDKKSKVKEQDDQTTQKPSEDQVDRDEGADEEVVKKIDLKKQDDETTQKPLEDRVDRIPPGDEDVKAEYLDGEEIDEKSRPKKQDDETTQKPSEGDKTIPTIDEVAQTIPYGEDGTTQIPSTRTDKVKSEAEEKSSEEIQSTFLDEGPEKGEKALICPLEVCPEDRSVKKVLPCGVECKEKKLKGDEVDEEGGERKYKVPTEEDYGEDVESGKKRSKDSGEDIERGKMKSKTEESGKKRSEDSGEDIEGGKNKSKTEESGKKRSKDSGEDIEGGKKKLKTEDYDEDANGTIGSTDNELAMKRKELSEKELAEKEIVLKADGINDEDEDGKKPKIKDEGEEISHGIKKEKSLSEKEMMSHAMDEAPLADEEWYVDEDGKKHVVKGEDKVPLFIESRIKESKDDGIKSTDPVLSYAAFDYKEHDNKETLPISGKDRGVQQPSEGVIQPAKDVQYPSTQIQPVDKQTSLDSEGPVKDNMKNVGLQFPSREMFAVEIGIQVPSEPSITTGDVLGKHSDSIPDTESTEATATSDMTQEPSGTVDMPVEESHEIGMEMLDGVQPISMIEMGSGPSDVINSKKLTEEEKAILEAQLKGEILSGVIKTDESGEITSLSQIPQDLSSHMSEMERDKTYVPPPADLIPGGDMSWTTTEEESKTCAAGDDLTILEIKDEMAEKCQLFDSSCQASGTADQSNQCCECRHVGVLTLPVTENATEMTQPCDDPKAVDPKELAKLLKCANITSKLEGKTTCQAQTNKKRQTTKSDESSEDLDKSELRDILKEIAQDIKALGQPGSKCNNIDLIKECLCKHPKLISELREEKIKKCKGSQKRSSSKCGCKVPKVSKSQTPNKKSEIEIDRRRTCSVPEQCKQKKAAERAQTQLEGGLLNVKELKMEQAPECPAAHPPECDCLECICAPCYDPKLLDEVLKESKSKLNAGKKTRKCLALKEKRTYSEIHGQRKEHTSSCTCLDCLCLPTVRKLAMTKEYPVPKKNQVYQVLTVSCSCTKKGSKIPISKSASNKPGSSKPCDCRVCKCNPCKDPNKKGATEVCDCNPCECEDCKTSKAPGSNPDKVCSCAPCDCKPNCPIKEKLAAERHKTHPKSCTCLQCLCEECLNLILPEDGKPSAPIELNDKGFPADCDCVGECLCPKALPVVHPMDCDCLDCACARINEYRKIAAGVHPADCDCLMCICPALEDFQKKHAATCDCPECECSPCAYGGGKTKMGCTCSVCSCENCTILGKKSTKKNGVCECRDCKCTPKQMCKAGRSIDPSKSEKEITPCDCAVCKCDDCPDTTKAKCCDCQPICECEDCEDPNVKKPDCVCDVCKCEEEKDCDCAVCKCEEPPPDSVCSCEVCKCADTDASPCGTPGCNCPICDCLKNILAAKADVITDDESKCTCTQCACLPGGETTQVDIQTHGMDCPCDACMCDKNKQDIPVCNCAQCVCLPRSECFRKGAAAAGDRIVKEDDLLKKSKDTIDMSQVPETFKECDCKQCECKKNRGAGGGEGATNTGGGGGPCPNCGCNQCVCHGSEKAGGATTQASEKKGAGPCPNCICVTCKCDSKTQGEQQVGTCSCIVCQCDTCKSGGQNKGKSEHGPCPNCNCSPCQCNKEGGAKASEDCKCTACKCDPCVFKKQGQGGQTGTCSCIVCQCDNCQSGGQSKSKSEHGSCPNCNCSPCKCDANTGKAEGKDVCKCSTCKCQPCEFKGGPSAPGKGPCPNCNCQSCKCQLSEQATKTAEKGTGPCPNCNCTPCKCQGGAVASGDGFQPKCWCTNCKCEDCIAKGGQSSTTAKETQCTCVECKCVECVYKVGAKKSESPQKTGPCPNCNCSPCTCQTKTKDGNDGQPPPFEVPVRKNCECQRCDCVICTEKGKGDTHNKTTCPDVQTDNKDSAPPFVVPVRKPCTCLKCDCAICENLKDKPSAPMDLKKCDSNTLRDKIEADKKETCQCRQEIEEIRKALDNIRCACTEAEMKAFQTKPFVKQASSFGDTMSGLKEALKNLEEKCKAKDRMIDAMTGELKSRGGDKYIDNVLKNKSPGECNEIPDYDKTKDTSSKSSSKPRKSRKKADKVDVTGFEIIDIRRITNDSLIIKWNSPCSSKIIGYDIFVNGVLKSKVMSGDRTSAMIHSLDLSATIQITIYAVTKCGRSDPPAIAIYEICK